MISIGRLLIKMNLKIPQKSHIQKFGLKNLFENGFLKRFRGTTTTKSVYLLDEDEKSTSFVNKQNVNKYANRTYTCGQLRMENVGERVTLCGWLEYQRMNKFVILRDGYGQTQLMIKDNDINTQKLLESLPFESVIQVKGTVLSRPVDMQNKKQSTGEIEVLIEDFVVLNKADKNLPFNIREFQKAKESLRMQYRYLDLRFPQMQRNLRVRSDMLTRMREYLVNNCRFVDVETPTLFKATPGGAQEFKVPTRFPGQFYSLVQSPQQFKQMLMAGSIDRYFQIARCYRDEGARPDRQPEFTQLDIEMSFTDRENILKLVEELLNYSWPEFLDNLPLNFPRISLEDAMEQYGCDCPDIRFDFKLKNCTNLLKNVLAQNENFGAYFIVFPKEYANLSKSVKLKMKEIETKYSKSKLVQNQVSNLKEFSNKLSKLLTIEVASNFYEFANLEENSVLFLAYGDKNETLQLLGAIRLEYVNYLENLSLTIRKTGMHFLWVLDFPLFETDSLNQLNSVHHPFTAPHPDDLHLLDSTPLKVRSLAYDLVLNGNEVGGGSIRIHDPKLQEKLFNLLRINQNDMKHIIEMLSSGCPPHGGIALGLDRLLSKILKTISIRDVIAFPKTFEGRDLLSGAPSPISQEDQRIYHIKSIYPES